MDEELKSIQYDKSSQSSGASNSVLREALNKVVLRSLQPVTAGLSAIYAVLSLNYFLLLSEDVARVMFAVALSTAVLMLALYFFLSRWEIPPIWAHPIGVSIAGLVLLNALFHLSLQPLPEQTVSVALLVIGAGCFFLSGRWLMLVLSAALIGWLIIFWKVGYSPAWFPYGFMLLMATVASGLIFTARTRASEQIERLRIQDEYQRVKLEKAEGRLRHEAYHDSLTELPNRRMFTEYLRLSIGRARRHKEYLFAVLFLDVDRFKNVNDSLGHTVGDQLLISIGQRIKDCLRQVDRVARFGGDEFAILLDAIEDASAAMRVAGRINHMISIPFDICGSEVFVTASIGIALSTTGYERQEDVLRDADAAMHRAKEQGKARYEVFDRTMHERALGRLQLETDLRSGIERREFCLQYQPIVSLKTGSITGLEALVRWHHPERGFTYPNDFISIAEDTGLIVPLGQWILGEACRQMSRWERRRSDNVRGLTLSVNISSVQFAQSGLAEQVKGLLQETGFDPRKLQLEITEGTLMNYTDTENGILGRLTSEGLQLSIDDFGTGYSSLSYLHRFPVQVLKIDRSFISQNGSGTEYEIVHTIIMLAHNLSMSVIAEGIETEDQLARLRGFGCEYGQGYLFYRPQDPEAIEDLLLKTGYLRP